MVSVEPFNTSHQSVERFNTPQLEVLAMVRKVFEKASLIPGVRNDELGATDPEAGRPRTAPGTMMGFMAAQSSAVAENEQLREKVVELEQGNRLRKLDPKSIAPSRWANRHETSFQTPEFDELRADIAAAGGNVQPIRVRRTSNKEQGAEFELVFGHRRHRACLDLEIAVLAEIVEATDQELFEQMERENRSRRDLSAWEQGVMFRRALDDKLYPSLRQLAESLQVDPSIVSKSVALARLPAEVVSAFSRPIDIQFRWAAPLSAAVEKDSKGVVAIARSISKGGETLSAKQTFALLIGDSTAAPVARDLVRDGKSIGRFVRDPRKGATLTLRPEALDKEVSALLDKLVAKVARADE